MSDYTTSHNMREWPYGLLDDLYAMHHNESVPDELPVDLEPSIIYAIGTLNDRTAKMLLMRYAEHLPYDVIAKEFGVTKERVRQIVQKGLRTLRHPSRMTYIRFGVRGTVVRERKLAAETARERAVADYLNTIGAEEIAKFRNDNKAKKQAIYDMHISELNLSARAYNILIRSGYQTVADIMRVDADTLKRCRNMGKKSYAEVIHALEEFGLDCLHLKEEDQ